MMRSAFSVVVALGLFFFCFIPASIGQSPSSADNAPFPTYGTGPVKVRLYTDYFCGPCRSMEPDLEPLLIELVKKTRIQITFVDTPIYQDSPLYARYFLYALNKKNDFEHALKVRSVLFQVAETNVVEKDKIEGALKKANIQFASFDANPVFQKYSVQLKEDGINATPTAVVIQGIKKETFKGGKEILRALEQLR
jgi:protein-disulfide isomerase